MVVVALRSAGGSRVLNVKVLREANVADIKRAAFITWQVPCSCQTVLLDTKVLRDTERISSLCARGVTKLSLTMVVCLNSVLKDLQSGNSSMQKAALADIGKLGAWADDSALVVAIVRVAADRIPEVRRAALRTLTMVASRGDEEAIAAAVRAVHDKDWRVRSEALDTLGLLAVKGDRKAIRAACSCFEDADNIVRHSAAMALGQLVEKGDSEVVSYLHSCLQHAHWGVRCAAVEALGCVACTGDEHSMDALSECLHDYHELVRRAAAEALGVVAQKGDRHAVSVVLAYVQDVDSRVRRAAVESLGHIAGRGDSAALRSACYRLQDPDKAVRRASALTVGHIAQNGDEHAIDAVRSILADEHWGVRNAARWALDRIRPSGDHHASKHAARVRDAMGSQARPLSFEELAGITDVHATPLIRERVAMSTDDAGREGVLILRTDYPMMAKFEPDGVRSNGTYLERVTRQVRAAIEEKLEDCNVYTNIEAARTRACGVMRAWKVACGLKVARGSKRS